LQGRQVGLQDCSEYCNVKVYCGLKILAQCNIPEAFP